MKKELFLTLNRLRKVQNGIGGELIYNGKRICYTLERPYNSNSNNISCIPNGLFSGYIRDRGLVAANNKEWRIELNNVPNRNVIQFHRGTIPTHSDGCILIGSSLTETGLIGDYGGWIKLMNTVYNHFGTYDLKNLKNSRVVIRFQGLGVPEFPTILK